MEIKNMHFYWGRNVPLTWPRFMSVYSFWKHNPNWNIIMHMPAQANTTRSWQTGEHKFETNGKDWIEMLPEIPNVHFQFEMLPDVSEVWRSDLLRWKILSRGGFWSDMDILYLKPLPDDLFVGGDVHLYKFKVDFYEWVQGKNYKRIQLNNKNMPIGFMGSRGTDKAKNFFLTLYKKSLEMLLNGCVMRGYQQIGRFLLENELNNNQQIRISYGDRRKIYPLIAQEIEMFNKPKQVRFYDFDKCFGIHWFAGDKRMQEFLNTEPTSENSTWLFEMMKGEYEL